jgi:transcriptional regulator with PAS, ATPase and Fis domain/CHASE2 domain-containing sensor protein
MALAARLFFTYRWVQAAVISAAAVSLAWFLWSLGPSTFTTIEHSWYDAWLHRRSAPPPGPYILVAVRDEPSEQLFGGGTWDRAVIARIVSALQEAGAAAMGIDIPIESPSPPVQGGAASDALLLEAVRSAGTVVYPTANLSASHTPSPVTGLHPLGQGDGLEQPVPAHMVVELDRDRIARRIPLFVQADGRQISAFALQLATIYRHSESQDTGARQGAPRLQPPQAGADATGTLRIPTDESGNMLVNFTGQGTERTFEHIGFSDLWQEIENPSRERLKQRARGKIAVLLAQPPPTPSHATPFGIELSEQLIHLHALDTILTERWLYELPAFPQLLIAMILCLAVGWPVLAHQAPKGLALAVTGLAVYLAIVLVALSAAHWVFPTTIPVTAGVLAIVAATMLGQILSARRAALAEGEMLHIQQELVFVREALIWRENAVEALEEDLEVARLSAASSATRQQELLRTMEELRGHMADAQRLEDSARRRIGELERELSSKRAVALTPPPLGDAEQEQLRQECARLGIVTCHAGILGMFRDLKKAAPSNVTILITGEPGTGKELFARAAHFLSPRAGKPFIAVNMAAISPELFESELFGHVRGSFTGALIDRKGYFELAHRGTIFLDEIGDLRLDHQSKLLRVLQDRTFYRVGATTPTTVEVRIVAATNKDLQRGVSEGWFREDLYYRLKGLVLDLPPLRDRPDDIAPLIHSCLHELSKQAHRDTIELSEEAAALLKRHPWKGNIRELRHCLEQAAALCEGPMITVAELRLQAPTTPPQDADLEAPLLPEPAGDAAVLKVLREHGFDMQATANALGWDRSTVTQRLKGLCFQALVACGGDRTKAASSLAGDPSFLRTVELKLMNYYTHLIGTLEPFASAEEALVDTKRRFKNLPERHFRSVEALVRMYFEQKTGDSILPARD